MFGCVPVLMQKRESVILGYHFLSYSFKHGLSLNVELGWLEATATSLPPPPSTGVTGKHNLARPFMSILGI